MDSQGYFLPSFNKVAEAMTAFRPMLNEISQDNNGDKSLRVDEEEIVIHRFNGDSRRDQKYRRHKDSYFRDKNN